MNRWILFAVFSILGAGYAHAAPIALVTDLTGGAQHGEGDMARPLEILDELDSGAVVFLEQGSQLSAVYLDSGHEYRYSGPAQVYFREDQPVTLAGDDPEQVALLEAGDGNLMGSVGVAQAAMVMRSAGSAAGTVELVSPVNTRVLAAHPVLSWRVVQGAQGYDVVLVDASEQTVWSGTVDGVQANLPDSVRLIPGARYTWKVTAQTQSGPGSTAWANFRVSGDDLRNEVERRRPAETAAFSERLLFAIWLQDQGLREEAQPYWNALAKERPDSRSLQALASS